jgi:ABC-type transporter Mla subunit MlaD
VSDYETTQRRRNIIVGVFVIVAVCAFFWLIFMFGDLPGYVSELKSLKVRVQFPTAPDVWRNTPVRFCGYQVGRVTKVEPPKVLKDLNTGQFYHQTVVVLNIERKYDDIPDNVDVKLMTRGLGSSYIELKLKHFDVMKPTGEFLVAGSLLQGSTGMTSEFFPEESQEKLAKLVDGLGTLIKNANDVLGDPSNKENFRMTLANLSEATSHAEQTVKEFQEFVAAGTTTSEELTKAVTELRIILDKVNSGQGSLARIVNDGRFYENLLENTRQLRVLLEDLTSFIAEVNEKGLKSKW